MNLLARKFVIKGKLEAAADIFEHTWPAVKAAVMRGE